MGMTLSPRRSETIHWTRKRIEKNACPTKPTDSQKCSLIAPSLHRMSYRQAYTLPPACVTSLSSVTNPLDGSTVHPLGDEVTISSTAPGLAHSRDSLPSSKEEPPRVRAGRARAQGGYWRTVAGPAPL